MNDLGEQVLHYFSPPQPCLGSYMQPTKLFFHDGWHLSSRQRVTPAGIYRYYKNKINDNKQIE